MTVRAISPRGRRRFRRGTATLVAAALLVPLVPTALAVAATTASAGEPVRGISQPEPPGQTTRPRPARPDDAGGKGRPDDPGGTGRGRRRSDAGHHLGLGSVLSGGGSVPTPNTPKAWADMVDGYQQEALSTRLGIPIIYGVDAVHGHGNVSGRRSSRTTRSRRDPRPEAGRAGERSRPRSGPPASRGTSPRASASPGTPAGVALRELRGGPGARARMESAVVGLQGPDPRNLDDNDRVLATIKHFAGDGDTRTAQLGRLHVDQGVTVTNRGDFARLDLAPYEAGGRGTAPARMPSFSSVDWTEDGVGNPIKMHANRELIREC